MNGHDFGICRLSHRKYLALWILDEFFYSILETVSFGCLNWFWITTAWFIADSRDSVMSMDFCKDKFAPSFNNLCCVQSWFIPHTKRSLNVESEETPYLQYWPSLLSSAMYCHSISPVFLLRKLNWNLSAIGFFFGFSWFAIKVTTTSKVFSRGFAGAVNPLNNR